MDGEIFKLIYRMSVSELLIWHELGGEIPADHSQLFLLGDNLRHLARENGTMPAEPPMILPSLVTRRKAIG